MKAITLILLFFSSPLMSWAQPPEIIYKESTKTFELKNPPPIRKAAGAKNTPKWTYFWEFGDGHYSINDRPEYCYENQGTYPVRVSLTPRYSYTPSTTIEQTVQIGRGCGQDRRYDFLGLVDIESDAANELIPNNQIQVAIQYRMPAGQALQGYLYLLYNAKAERDKIGFPPLKLVTEEKIRTHGARRIPYAKNVSSLEGVGQAGKSYINQLLSEQQYSLVAFKSAPLIQQGDDQRVFVTLAASSALDTLIIKRKRGQLTTQLKAVWLPDGEFFNPDVMVANYDLILASVHDPNKIILEREYRPAFYKKGTPERLVYTVKFQNKGGRASRGLEVAIPWDKNLDYSSIEVLDRTPSLSDGCVECPNNLPPNDEISCFRVDKSRINSTGKIYFYFHNVLIHGKREPGVGGGKYTKGEITFAVNSTDQKTQTIQREAEITFIGDNMLRTNIVQKNWRHKGFGLKIGRNLLPNINDFIGLTDSLSRWVNVGFYFRNSALRDGFTPLAGGELSYSGVGFESETVTPIFSIFDNPGGNELSQLELVRERVTLQTLDLQLQSEIRALGFLSAGVGAGVSLPLKARADIQANVVNGSILADADYFELFAGYENIEGEVFDDIINLEGLFSDTATNTFGLLDDRETTTIFTDDLASSLSLGYMANWFIEAGALNNVAVGFRQHFRIYPESYRAQCIKYNHFEVYLRLKLNSMK